MTAMKLNEVRKIFTGAAAVTAIGSCSDISESPEQPMNIIYIMCDDHSYQTISAYNRTLTNTPNIDRLCANYCIFGDIVVVKDKIFYYCFDFFFHFTSPIFAFLLYHSFHRPKVKIHK